MGHPNHDENTVFIYHIQMMHCAFCLQRLLVVWMTNLEGVCYDSVCLSSLYRIGDNNYCMLVKIITGSIFYPKRSVK